MKTVSIPKEVQKALMWFLSLQDDVRLPILSELAHIKPCLAHSDLRRQIREILQKHADVESHGEVDALLGLYATWGASGLSLDDFAERVLATLGRPHGEQVTEERKRILISWLRVPAVAISVKSAQVITAHSRVLRRSRIFTDVRPVFLDDLSMPAAFVLAHSLKLDVFENGELQEYFVALDTRDLDDLQADIERAKKKAAAIRSALSSSLLIDGE